MKDLKYKVVKNDEQYFTYCERIEELLVAGLDTQQKIDEYELLHVLISDWDEKHRLGKAYDPIQLTKAYLKERDMNQSELAEACGVTKGYISEILNYKKELSKTMIRKLSNVLHIRQDALNQPYVLKGKKVMA
jgi:HTH-type transcriptional regulator/antitoxin HigA